MKVFRDCITGLSFTQFYSTWPTSSMANKQCSQSWKKRVQWDLPNFVQLLRQISSVFRQIGELRKFATVSNFTKIMSFCQQINFPKFKDWQKIAFFHSECSAVQCSMVLGTLVTCCWVQLSAVGLCRNFHQGWPAVRLQILVHQVWHPREGVRTSRPFFLDLGGGESHKNTDYPILTFLFAGGDDSGSTADRNISHHKSNSS